MEKTMMAFKGSTVLRAAAVAAVLVGGAAAPAMATGDHDTKTTNGNGADQAFGNVTTHGGMNNAPVALLNGGVANKPCLSLLPQGKIPVQNLVPVGVLANVPISVQDINAANQNLSQGCTENSTAVQGDAPLSHILDGGVPIAAPLSGNH